ncbi:hypothetical protein [Hymenobacter sp.]|uniref:hypothetical protein n=1 Tax=Hymenobacter sp. TaxID=1898978 RepID=UPI00286C6444|nr:hypothetical protein [Hymenobacter sp.]
MKKFAITLAASLFTLGLVSCQDDDSDLIILSPVAGDYTGNETCAPSPAGGDYVIHIYNTAANDGKVFIDNIYNIGNRFEADVSGNNITMVAQPYSYVIPTGPNAGTYTGNVSATGTVEGEILTLNFTLDGGLADNCQYVGNRGLLP